MASRKEQKAKLRAERERRAAEAAARERRRKLIGYGIAGLLGAAALAAILVVVLVSDGAGGGSSDEESRAAEPNSGGFVKASIPPMQETTLEDAAKAANCKVQEFPDFGKQHVSGRVEYETNPPTSGNHAAMAAEDGAYSNPPDMEPIVHSMEHGRVVLWFQADAPEQQKGQMKALFDEDPYHMLLSPNARDMKPQVAASAWTRSITCPTVTDKTWDALRLFRDKYRDQGPEQVP